MFGLIVFHANCMLILPLILQLHVMCKARHGRLQNSNANTNTNTKSEPVVLSKALPVKSPATGNIAPNALKTPSKGTEIKEKGVKDKSKSEVIPTPNAAPKSQTQPPIVRRLATAKLRRKISMQPTFEADFEPGEGDRQDLIAAAEEMAKDAGAYENMDPNEGAAAPAHESLIKKRS
ncbi:hypothetical protein V3C99_012959 [Haemonchus contortus]|uniref:Uncharacterized protein n=1 Tax=Haemonchus contortus TaxID=6289 RepID=A0A7I4Y2M3_HAECO